MIEKAISNCPKLEAIKQYIIGTRAERYRRTIQKIYGTERKRRGRKNEKEG